MLRTISNRFYGRRRTTYDSIDLSDVLRLLSGLNGTTKISLNYRSNGDNVTNTGRTSSEASEFIGERFESSLCQYCEATHEIFSGKKDERHYIEVREGLIGNKGDRERPYKRATLEYRL